MSGPLAARVPYLAAGLAVVALDRITKLIVEDRLRPLGSVPVIPGLFDLSYVRNPGGVFGLFRNLDGGLRGILFTVIPAAAVVMIAVYAMRIPAARRLTQTALALILGGALGNLVDRLAYGHVIDFLDVYWRDHHWPAFNVADSAICVGVGLLIFESLFVHETPERDGEGGASRESGGGDTPASIAPTGGGAP